MTGGMATRLFYVDDSGAPDTGWILYSWIECRIDDWRTGLRAWLDFRKALYVTYRIPTDYELHATKFVGGRGNPSADSAWNRNKHLRTIVVERALAAIGECPSIRIGTAYRHIHARGSGYARDAAQTYRAAVAHLDRRLAKANELGLLLVDGDGTDLSYQAAHRDLRLADRHIIEDPLFQPAHRSQWLQMADLVAYSAYHSLVRIPGKKFAWDWYDNYLAGSDTNSRPIQV